MPVQIGEAETFLLDTTKWDDTAFRSGAAIGECFRRARAPKILNGKPGMRQSPILQLADHFFACRDGLYA